MNREVLRLKAQQDSESWKEFYKEEIDYSIEESIIFDSWAPEKVKQTSKVPEIILESMGTQEAVRKYQLKHPALLNFASYKHPGGGYISGAWAQEESLCHSSVLYQVLVDFEEEYAQNRKYLNNGLYRNWAIYSPLVQFTEKWKETKTEDEKFNVLTCPAPNLSAYKTDDLIYEKALYERQKFILDIFEDREDSTLILGAFGCGVFDNDPVKVAGNFKSLLESKTYSFDTVVFAIPGGENYKQFKRTLKI